MAQTLGSQPQASLASILARTNWWLIGAVAAGLAFWVAVIATGRALLV